MRGAARVWGVSKFTAARRINTAQILGRSITDGVKVAGSLEADRRLERCASVVARAKRSYDDPEGADLADRCLLPTRADASQGSLPIIPGPAYSTYYQIVQTDDYVMILAEWYHDARIIRLLGNHPPASVRKWLGDSVGHWEDKTLVVNTTNFRSDVQAINSSEQLHVVERFTRIDADTILYRATVTHPGTWVTPWTAELTFRATTYPMFEFACHEGNYAIENFMRGARFKDRAKSTDPDQPNK